MKVYFDGVLQKHEVDMNYPGKTSWLCIPAGTRVLAIECEALHLPPGILASTNTSVVTDGSWHCSGKAAEGWAKPAFQDSGRAFTPAKVLRRNDAAPIKPQLPWSLM